MVKVTRRTPKPGPESDSRSRRRATLIGVVAVVAGGALVVAVQSDGDQADASTTAGEMSARPVAVEEPLPTGGPTAAGDADGAQEMDASATGTIDEPEADDAGAEDVDGAEEDGADLAPAASPTKTPAPIEVGVRESADTGTGVVVDVVAFEVVEAEGGGPGDIGGDAYRVDLELTNRSGDTVDLGAVVLTADLADGTPVSPVSGDPEAEPFVGELASAGSVSGAYLFSVPPGANDDLRLSFSYEADAPVVVFSGSPDDV